MMNYVFPLMLVLSFVSALFTGQMPTLSSAVTQGAQNAVSLILKVGAMLCFWGGITEIMSESGLTEKISRLLKPILTIIFPRLKREDEILEVMSFNITANILGLGNAATPAGIETMRRLGEINPYDNRASDEMVFFVVMNTAALRLVPTTVATLRGEYGSANPMEIFLPSLLTSVCALAVGMTVAKIGNRLYKGERK